ncbi:MAG: SDR family oxidoreductase [Acidimicrobiales bacterium]|jgi:short-subunit dehydrogenase|nr:SDR family oxidoreductase [Acidimicrobiales bacterium]
MRDTAVVTGGAGGLGAALCRRFAAEGYEVVPVDVSGTDRPLDVTDPAACRALAEELRPALWVNNAGLGGTGDLLDGDDDAVRRMVEVDLLGVIWGTRAAVATMRRDGRGTVLNVASLAGWAPVPHLAAYSAAKHGVRAYRVAAAAELRGTPVRVQCLLPDGIRTPMVDVHDPRNLMSFTGKRLLEADEVAEAALALLRSRRVLASVPPRRGVTVRLLGVLPALAFPLQGTIERRARRNQRRAATRTT